MRIGVAGSPGMQPLARRLIRQICCELPGTASYSAKPPSTGAPLPQRAAKAVGISPEASSTSQPSARSRST